jgi:fatty acid desaturase
MTIRSEFKNLFNPRQSLEGMQLRRVAFKSLALLIPMPLLWLIALPWIAVNALGIFLTWFAETTEPYMLPKKTARRIYKARQKCRQEVYDINSATEKAAS